MTGTVVTVWPPRGGWLWRPLVGASLSQLVLGIARPSISYSALDLGGDGTVVGILAAAYAIVPMFIALPVGRLTGRLSRIAVVPLVSALLFAGACALAAAATDLVVLGLASAVLGLANLGLVIGAQSWISRSAPSSRYNEGFGWMTAGMAAGQAVGPLVAGILIGPGDATRTGIVHAFLVATAVAALVAVAFASPADRRYADADAGAQVATGEILRLPGVVRYMVVSAALLTTVDIVTAYLPVLGAEAGIAPVLIGAMLAVRGATSTLSRVLLGPLARRWGASALMVASTFGAAVSLTVVALVPVDWVLFVALAIAGFFLGMGQPLTMTAVAVALPAPARSSGLAVRLLGNRVAQTLTPLVAGAATAVIGVASVFLVQVAGLVVSAAWEWRATRVSRARRSRPGASVTPDDGV